MGELGGQREREKGKREKGKGEREKVKGEIVHGRPRE
jgi:hypothetical protein